MRRSKLLHGRCLLKRRISLIRLRLKGLSLCWDRWCWCMLLDGRLLWRRKSYCRLQELRRRLELRRRSGRSLELRS